MRAQRHAADNRGSVFSLLSDTADYLVQNMGLLFVLIAITIAWAFWGPVSIQPNSPPQALLILAALTIGTAFFVRATRQRFGLDTRTSLTLPDPLYTLYLATIVLAGTTGAIVLALATPLIVGLPDVLRKPRDIPRVLRQSVAAGITTLLAGWSTWRAPRRLAPPSVRNCTATLLARFWRRASCLPGRWASACWNSASPMCRCQLPGRNTSPRPRFAFN